jgi:hypothetical protein
VSVIAPGQTAVAGTASQPMHLSTNGFGWCPHSEAAIHETFGANARHAVKISHGVSAHPAVQSNGHGLADSWPQLPIKDWISNKCSGWTSLAQGGCMNTEFISGIPQLLESTRQTGDPRMS